jgi:hypothetical protein
MDGYNLLMSMYLLPMQISEHFAYSSKSLLVAQDGNVPESWLYEKSLQTVQSKIVYDKIIAVLKNC